MDNQHFFGIAQQILKMAGNRTEQDFDQSHKKKSPRGGKFRILLEILETPQNRLTNSDFFHIMLYHWEYMHRCVL